MDRDEIDKILSSIKLNKVNFNKRNVKYLEEQLEETLKELLAYNSLNEKDYMRYKQVRGNRAKNI